MMYQHTVENRWAAQLWACAHGQGDAAQAEVAPHGYNSPTGTACKVSPDTLTCASGLWAGEERTTCFSGDRVGLETWEGPEKRDMVCERKPFPAKGSSPAALQWVSPRSPALSLCYV